MRIIRLNDGTVHSTDYCGAADGILRIRITDTEDLMTALLEFSDKSKTVHIVNTRDSEGAIEFVYDGYTKLFSLNLEETGIHIALRKEETS